MQLTDLPKRQLGTTHMQVVPLGLGGASLGHGYTEPSSDEDALEAVHRAIELGMNYIDTSPGYGESERRIGLALEGGWRSRIYLATKTGTGVRPGNYSADWTYRSVERSMELLKTDYLDLVQVHDPSDMDPVFAKDGALTALHKLKAEGVIGAIGLGVRDHEFHLRAIESGMFDTILTYADFNLVRQTARDTLFPRATEKGMGIILGSPILFGWLSNRPIEDNIRRRRRQPPELPQIQQLASWAQKHQVPLLSLALQYCLREPRVAITIVGARNRAQVEEHIQAVTEPLPESIWNELKQAFGV